MEAINAKFMAGMGFTRLGDGWVYENGTTTLRVMDDSACKLWANGKIYRLMPCKVMLDVILVMRVLQIGNKGERAK